MWRSTSYLDQKFDEVANARCKFIFLGPVLGQGEFVMQINLCDEQINKKRLLVVSMNVKIYMWKIVISIVHRL